MRTERRVLAKQRQGRTFANSADIYRVDGLRMWRLSAKRYKTGHRQYVRQLWHGHEKPNEHFVCFDEFGNDVIRTGLVPEGLLGLIGRLHGSAHESLGIIVPVQSSLPRLTPPIGVGFAVKPSAAARGSPPCPAPRKPHTST